mgnify:CR=1 FL=1
MVLIDGHAHLDTEELLPKVNELLAECDIIVVNASVDYATSLKVIELARKHERVIPAIGFHPEFVTRGEEVPKVLELLQYALEVSEVGLDYYWIKDEALRKKEIEVLTKFLEAGEKLGLPVVLHSRGGNRDLLNLLPSFKVSFAIHAFEGSVKDAKKFVDLGGFISVPPVVVRDKTRTQVVKEIDLDYLLTETDSPFMSAEKGSVNRPCEVKRVIAHVSQVKGVGEADVAEKIEENFKRFFNVSRIEDLLSKKEEKISNFFL